MSGRPVGFRSRCQRCRSPSRSRNPRRCSTGTSSPWRPRSSCAPIPIDGAVLMGGCDKTTPALLMGAITHGPAGHLRPRRTDAARQLARQHLGQRQRRMEVLGREARRHHRRVRVGRDRGRHRPLAGPLHDHGHRLDHDRRRRGPRHDPPGSLLHPRRRLRPPTDGLDERAQDRRDGLG